MPNSSAPALLWIVRHGESAGNVARDAAEAAGHPIIDIASRDQDVPLSELGQQQAQALGKFLAELPPGEQPTAALVSPYVRAHDTARIALEAAGLDVPLVLDERLREREFGVLDRLTRVGITQQFPDQAEARARIGKFYHRPPGGESWADVIFRVRGVVDTVLRDYADGRVLVVAHQVVVLTLRYVIEAWNEAEILAVDRAAEVANCSITTYRRDDSIERGIPLRLEVYNDVRHLAESDAAVTREPDAPAAPR
ncbi:MAG TPA: histidine phosphatase family protein [Mycobacteriales bacterium]|nr:histidine phosphatase family protein [Mycobacteriales bacterium]